MVLSNNLRGLCYLLVFSLIDSQFTSTPNNPTTACTGSELSLEWVYSETELDTVLWKKGANTVLVIDNADSTVYTTNTVEHVSKGNVKLSSLSPFDSGVYTIDVMYTLWSGSPTLTDTVTVTVVEGPTGLSFTVSSSTYTCTAASLGTPAVDLLVRVNDVLQTGSTYTSTSGSDKIECCFSGAAATCSTGTTNPYCIVAKGEIKHIFLPASTPDDDISHM